MVSDAGHYYPRASNRFRRHGPSETGIAMAHGDAGETPHSWQCHRVSALDGKW